MLWCKYTNQTGMLPTYQRLSEDGSITTKDLPNNRKKFLILLSFAMLVFVCLSGSRFLNDNDNSLSASDERPVWNKNVYPEEIQKKEMNQVNSSNDTSGDAPPAMWAGRVGGAQAIQRGLPDGEDKDPIARARRNKVKEVSCYVAVQCLHCIWNCMRPINLCSINDITQSLSWAKHDNKFRKTLVAIHTPRTFRNRQKKIIIIICQIVIENEIVRFSSRTRVLSLIVCFISTIIYWPYVQCSRPWIHFVVSYLR